MFNMDYYYQVLGLKTGVSEEEIRQAYRDLVNVWHPDRFSHNPRLQEKAQEKLKEINEACRVLLSSLPSTFAQKPERETEESGELLPKKQNDKYGYANMKGETVIRPQFDLATEFSEGVAAVNTNGKWGYIDKTGKTVINPQFDFASRFSEGLAAVMTGHEWGYIDNTGRPVIDFKFDFALPFFHGLGIVKVCDKWGCIDKTGVYKTDLGFLKEEQVSPEENTIEDIERMTENEFSAFIEALFRQADMEVERGKDHPPCLVLHVEEETPHESVRLVVRTKISQSLIDAKVVKEMFEGRDDNSTDGLILITNNYYSEEAVEFAESNSIRLWDRDALADFYCKVANK